MRIIVAILLLVVAIQAPAVTYYIDYASGSDANNGTATNTPWKLCPYMAGFGGSYAHSAGDAFLFKGGVTWPNAAFPLNITASGGATNDTYGSSQSYYAGGAWTRPLFDLQYTNVTGNKPIYITSSNITISGIEIARLLVPNSGSWNGYGAGSIATSATARQITVQDCYIHNWRAGTATNDVSNTDSDFGGIFFGSGTLGIALQNTIGPGEAPVGLTGNSGCGVAGSASLIQSNTFIGCMEMINGGATNISFNTFRNGTNSYDPINHPNAIYHGVATGQRTYIYNNIIHDFDTKFQTMLLHGGYGGATNTIYYIYNNVVWNVSSPIDIDESNVAVADSATYAYVFNNTVQHDIAVGAVKRGQTYHLTEINCVNNHWISDTPTGNPIGTAATTSAYAPVGTLVDTSNVWLTAASAATAGYTVANQYAPPLPSSPTVGVGSNLTSSNLFTVDIRGNVRPASGAWDAGAYEYVNPSVGTGSFNTVRFGP